MVHTRLHSHKCTPFFWLEAHKGNDKAQAEAKIAEEMLWRSVGPAKPLKQVWSTEIRLSSIFKILFIKQNMA